jgi:hypothetical protein
MADTAAVENIGLQSTAPAPGVEPPPPEPRTKACRYCAVEIPHKAILCGECGSFQDWRGRASASALVLSLLVALISVLGSTIPVFTSATRAAASDLSVQAFFYTDSGLSLLVRNRGSRPGFVKSCKVAIINDGNRVWDFNFNLDGRTSSRIVGPDALQEVFWKTDMNWVETYIQKNGLLPKVASGELKARVEVELGLYEGKVGNAIVGETPFKHFFWKY